MLKSPEFTMSEDPRLLTELNINSSGGSIVTTPRTDRRYSLRLRTKSDWNITPALFLSSPCSNNVNPHTTPKHSSSSPTLLSPCADEPSKIVAKVNNNPKSRITMKENNKRSKIRTQKRISLAFSKNLKNI